MKIKYALSYFYQIRFFSSTMLPMSTAVWDPKWFHDYSNKSNIFIDKRGVINGVRCDQLVPGKSCDNLCRGPENCSTKDPQSCAFLNNYRKQLDAININKFLADVNNIAMNWFPEGIDECTVVFIVYEAPNNPCSERHVLLKWFEDNNIDCKELEYPITRRT